jgi:Kef-type K+ transport system membrane component KefB
VRLGGTHVVLVLLPITVAIYLLASHGSTRSHRATPPDAVSGAAVWRCLLALAVIIAAARLGGALSAAILQPAVVGEMLSGMLLGPSALGLLAPDVYTWLFGGGVLPYIGMISQLGLAYFMFLVGLELDRGLLRNRGGAVTVVGQVSVGVPLVLGVAVGLAMYDRLGPSSGDTVTFALFIGVAMSVTAFPVLARILMERGMFQTPVGGLAMVCAAIADVVAWLLLAVVVAQVRGDSALAVARTGVLAMLMLAVMVFVVRPLLRRLLTGEHDRPRGAGALGIVLVGVLAAAVCADLIGIHLIFGAFLFGAVCPRESPRLQLARGRIQDVTVALLLPPFFASVGLQTRIGLLGGNAAYWGWFVLLLLVAVAGKWVGTTAGSLAVGIEPMTSVRLGVLMNCKGLTELVILTVGLQLGVLPPRLFTMLVLVAVIATMMTAPLLAWLDRVDRSAVRSGDVGPARMVGAVHD